MATSKLNGVVEATFWYKNGTPRGALDRGERTESVEMAFSGWPLTPTKVPRRVKRFCEAVREMDRREDVDPKTSKRASGEEAEVVESGEVVSMFGVEVEGVA